MKPGDWNVDPGDLFDNVIDMTAALKAVDCRTWLEKAKQLPIGTALKVDGLKAPDAIRQRLYSRRLTLATANPFYAKLNICVRGSTMYIGQPKVRE